MQAPERKNERGSAMIMAIFVLFLLTSVGTALLFLGENEVKMSQADINAKRAFYMAEAGLEAARLQLWNTNGLDEFDDDLEDAAGPLVSDTIELLDPEAITPVFDANDQLIGITGAGNDVPLIAITAVRDGWVTAFLTNDPIDGRGNLADSNERVAIIAVGAGRDRSFEIVEAIIELRPLLPMEPPAAVTLLGPPPNVWNATSKVKDYVGDDCSGAGVADLDMPIIGAIGAAAEAAAEDGIEGNPDYVSGSHSAEEAFSDLTDAGDPAVDSGLGTIDAAWLQCTAWQDTLEDLRYNADVVCTGSPCVFPDYGPGRVIFIDSDYSLSHTQSGAGVLVVTGTLTLQGRTSWSGLILVVGEGQYRLNGAGNGQISGSMILADIAGPDNQYNNSDDCTGGTDGFDTASYDERGGGNALTQYCSTDINVSNHKPYEVVEFVQR